MFYLHWADDSGFGERRAAYATLDEARDQAAHDFSVGINALAVRDGDGNELDDLSDLRLADDLRMADRRGDA